MKKLLLATLAVLSLNAFSQSYVVLSSGVVLTTDKIGNVWDYQLFLMPYQIKINGGSFLVEDEKLSTIDEKGFFYNKDLKIKKFKGKGLNYLVDDDANIITIASNGNYFKYKDDNLKKADKFGGNFFVVTKDAKKRLADLYTLNSLGNYSKLSIPGLNPMDISVFGGTYFVANGIMHTVSKDGIVSPKTMFRIPGIKKLGGTFFIDINKQLWTISDSGIISTPGRPLELNLDLVDKLGSNYMIDTEGRMFLINSAGNIMLKTAVMNHDLRNAKVLSR